MRLFILLGAALLSGCSAFKPATQSVIITASDTSAEIFINAEPKGVGTVTAELRRNKSHAIMAKVGDRVGTATIGTSVSATGILDIVGGLFWLVPLIGIVTPGFYDLDQTTFMIAIPPERDAPW